MRTSFTSLCFTVGFMLAFVADVSAQQSGRRTVNQRERVARASWQPVRNATANDDETAEEPVDGSSLELAAPVRRKPIPAQRQGKIRRVDHVEGTLPAPAPSGSVSVVQPEPTPIRDSSMPLDGQVVSDSIVYESTGAPIYDGGVMPYDGSCDAMPGYGCGCDSAVCTGDCGGCDSIGCGNGTCGSKNCVMCGELSSGPAWRPALTIRLPQDGWFSAEYLHWWQDGMRLPPLVTTSPTGTARANAGVLGQPGTQILFGGGDVLDGSTDGLRLNFGFWFDRCHTVGIGADYFNVGSETDALSRNSDGSTILARPFFNTQTDQEDSELVAFDGVVIGSVDTRATSELYGGGFYFRRLHCCNDGCTGGWLCGCSSPYCSRTESRLGYRYLQLDESVQITERLTGIDPTGNFNPIIDQFEVRNQFNGFDMGWSYRRVRDFWSCDALLKLAIGNTRQRISIRGETTIIDPTEPQPTTQTGGLLAQVSNIGDYENDEFAVVPEFNLSIGYQWTDHFRLTLGYTAIYWSNVVRAGDQISRDLNPNQLPPETDPFVGSRRPAFTLLTSDYWVQGINFGGEYRW